MKTIDIKTFSDQLHEDMKGQLELTAQDNQDVIAKASKSQILIKSILNKLKDFVYKYKFQEKKEEIEFFKEIKPVFVSQYYYHGKLFSIKMNEPFGSTESLRAYYYHELDQLYEFTKANQEFYKYCLSNSTHFDDKYFTREDSFFKSHDADAVFCTGYDNTLSIILANQMVKEYLLGLIKRLSSEFSDPSPSPITWTTTKNSLIELIYALQSVEAINNGKADIKQIAAAFETLFNIDLGDYYRQFLQIRLRKNGKTSFLDQMREKLTQRMDDFE